MRSDAPASARDGYEKRSTLADARKALIGSLVAFSLILPGCRGTGRRLVILNHRIWQVDRRGRIAPFPFYYPARYTDAVYGSTIPLPSPDGRWIAFGRDYDAYLLKVSSRKERRITRLGRAPRGRYVCVEVMIEGWSADSRELLLGVFPGENVSEEGDLLTPKAPYGFCVYSLRTRAIKPVALPDAFVFWAWLPDGRILGAIEPRTPLGIQRVVTLRPDSSRLVPVRAPAGRLDQVQVTRDGRWMAGFLDANHEGRRELRLVKIDLATMQVEPETPVGSWAEYQRPRLSPDGRHFSYIHQAGTVMAIPPEELMVDGRSLYPCRAPVDYRWVSEQMIALSCQANVFVFDAVTGRRLGLYHSSAATTQP